MALEHSVLLVAALGPSGAVAYWQGVVKVDGMIHEPGGYHPYVATITLRLREGERVGVPGGFRVPLVSDGGVNDARTSVHQEGGLLLCSGIGSGDAEAAEIEIADPVVRRLEPGEPGMQGSFEATKTRGAVRYDYKISWSLACEHSRP